MTKVKEIRSRLEAKRDSYQRDSQKARASGQYTMAQLYGSRASSMCDALVIVHEVEQRNRTRNVGGEKT